MASTPAADRPIGRTSSSEKRMALPCRVIKRISSWPYVSSTQAKRSPSSTFMAVTTPRLAVAKSSRVTRLMRPPWETSVRNVFGGSLPSGGWGRTSALTRVSERSRSVKLLTGVSWSGGNWCKGIITAWPLAVKNATSSRVLPHTWAIGTAFDETRGALVVRRSCPSCHRVTSTSSTSTRSRAV